jgi:hypothetical protein
MASPSASPSLPHRRISTPPTDAVPIPDAETHEDLPLTMSASVVLTSLPRDATAALAAAGAFEREKGLSYFVVPVYRRAAQPIPLSYNKPNAFALLC